MNLLSHPAAVLSIGLGLLGGALVLGAASSAGAASAATGSPYFGRWTVHDADQKYSARGKLYHTIDIAPCGKDFCGVSVAPNGTCGPALFRFLMKNSHGRKILKGHALWGAGQKNLTIESFSDDSFPGKRGLDLNLGEGYNFNDRDGNIPKFYATYHAAGAAKCLAH